MIEFVSGDMFATPADIRVNTVNCVGVMGAGVALAFKQRYPAMYKDYKRACKDGLIRPGKLHEWRSLEGDWVVNFPTKRDWKDPSRYEDISDGLDALRAYLEPLGSITILLPALGCGHGGLDWNKVSQLIESKLEGLSARILVFAPSDSKSAGRTKPGSITLDEKAAVEQLGYVQSSMVSKGKSEGPAAFVKGEVDLIKHNWIALLPSRDPEEREMSALQSIASELAARNLGVAVAMLHNNRSSERISEIFSTKGIDVVLLLPFGVLTRKTLAQSLRKTEGMGARAIVSFVAPNAKWDQNVLAKTFNVLRSGASTVIFSEPDLSWVASQTESNWGAIPSFFVRYDNTKSASRDAVSRVRASAIGRRAETGTPNLDALAAAVMEEAAFIAAEDQKPDGVILGTEPYKVDQGGSESHTVSFDFHQFPKDTWLEIVSLLREADTQSALLVLTVTEAAKAKKISDRLSNLKHIRD